MPRTAVLADAQLPDASRPMVDAVKAKLGMAPNIIRTLAHAPAALDAYLSMSPAVAGGALSAGEREEVALVVAQANGCGYCLSAHSLMAQGAGVSPDKQLAPRQGEASPLTALARKVPLTRAQLNLADSAPGGPSMTTSDVDSVPGDQRGVLGAVRMRRRHGCMPRLPPPVLRH